METKHQPATEHIPDENYIERLFPKCPPKQKSGGGKRSSKGSNQQQQRKQTKIKVHQHSRRELEARRNKMKTSASTSMIAAPNNNLSSESSDEQTTTASNRANNRIQRNNISHSSTLTNMQSMSANNTHKSSNNNLPASGTNSSTTHTMTTSTNNTTNNANPTVMSLTNSSSTINQKSPISHRKSGKYTASQNLLQQLKKHQSYHNSSNQSNEESNIVAMTNKMNSKINSVDNELVPVKELEIGLNKISLTISCDQEELCDSNHSRQDSSPVENEKQSPAQSIVPQQHKQQQQQAHQQSIQSSPEEKITLFFGPERTADLQSTVKLEQNQEKISTPSNETKSVLKNTSTPTTTPSSCLRHHSLPNEISHYSIVRPNNSSTVNNSDSNAQPTRKLSVRFNDISDKDSEPEELNIQQQQQHLCHDNEVPLTKESTQIDECHSIDTQLTSNDTTRKVPSPPPLSLDASITLLEEQEESLEVYEGQTSLASNKEYTSDNIKLSSDLVVDCDQEVLCDVTEMLNESPPSPTPSQPSFDNLKQQASVQSPVATHLLQQEQQMSLLQQDQQHEPQQQLRQTQQQQTQEEKNSSLYNLELNNNLPLTSNLTRQPAPLNMGLTPVKECEVTPTKATLDSSSNLAALQNQGNENFSSVVEAPNQNLIVKNANLVCNNNTSASSNVIPRSSSIKFNTLSDNESGPEDSPPIPSTQNSILTAPGRSYMIAKKCDIFSQHQAIASSTGIQRNAPSFSSFSTSKNVDEDSIPTTKTALIFPRLDEGLSSEAESNEEEVEEEDERAMDGDVDADDDDDEDDDDEDGDDDMVNDSMQLDRNVPSPQATQSNIHAYSRQQHQLINNNNKPQNRLIGSIQQQQNVSPQISMTGENLNTTDIHQVKVPGTAYGGYIQNQTNMLDNNDLKLITNNYPTNQNGVQPNYWSGGKTNQALNTSSHPTSGQGFTPRNNTIDNNSFNTSEAAKVITSRPSSDTDNETDRLLGHQRNDQLKLNNNNTSNINNSSDLQQVSSAVKHNSNSREVLIEGVLFNVKYLGSTHSDCEARSDKEDRIHQAEMAVHEVKFRNGLSQSATEVQLFISTEKIMVLDDKHRKIMMDHSIKTISYIADIGDAIVLFVRKKNNSNETTSEMGRPMSKVSCHVFESSESHTITKSISQAFQVAYTEMLKATGTGDTSSYLPKELDYQEVLNSQEMSTDELEMFARKENEREIIVPKQKGEILGLSIVESGWGSVLPAFVIANLKHDGPAYRCKRLSIGDQILSVNGNSLVGLPLAECQEILRKTKNQRVARLLVVPCPITVEVKIKRPDVKYQLGFSVQNGVICSLLRGGIAERGGVRVGHRIMSINGTTVVGVPHEKIVTLLASSVGEIQMKTCLTSLYRLILGEEKPVHF